MKYSIILTLLLSPASYAAWIGPTEVLSGIWGTGPTEFYVDWGDSPAYAQYPGISDISSAGKIAIADQGFIKLYSNTGQWIRNITPPYNTSSWSYSPRFIIDNMVLTINNYYFLSNEGALLNKISSPGKSKYKGELNSKLYVYSVKPSKRWLVYSPDGILLNTFTEKPLELGHISQSDVSFQGNDLYRISVAFPNKEWKIISTSGPCGEYNYKQDNVGNLYCVGTQSIVRYSACGKTVSSFQLPQNVTEEQGGEPGIDANITILESYSGLKMVDNGDVYTSRVTPTNYSVIKWTWQASPEDNVGGPDAPTDFFANVLAPVVTLAWRPSLQDPGCVTGYEVSRATVAAGPYTALTATGAGVKTFTDTTVVSGTTYYYKVRALSAVADSVYTNELSAVVP